MVSGVAQELFHICNFKLDGWIEKEAGVHWSGKDKID